MATGLQLGEQVFVPVSLLENIGDHPSAFIHREVLELAGRSVRIEIAGASHWVASSRCQRNIGLLIFSVGDLLTEATLLDPLSKSVTQFCRLLASDDYVRFYKVRSMGEVSAIWVQDQAAYSHVVVIGHGNAAGLQFAVDGWKTSAEVAEVLDIVGATPKLVVSLACQSGLAAVGRPMSEMHACNAFIGAFQSVHGAIASQFVQSLLVFHLLQGEATKVAFRHARDRVPGSTSFRLWRKGVLTTDA